MFRAFSWILLAAASLAAQSPSPSEPPVRVPTFPNSTCPIMGKKVSTKLFIDIEYGRVYICCKGCDKKILRAPELAYKTAFPSSEKIDNTVCPVSGLPIGEDAVAVSLQGVEFRVAAAEHATAAIADAQIVLNKLKNPALVDVGNRVCPISGAPAQANAFAIIGKHLVRLASPEHLAAVEKAPAATLKKAQQLARSEAKPVPASDKDAAGKDAADRDATGKTKDTERKR